MASGVMEKSTCEACGYLPAPIPENEEERLLLLRSLGLLDTSVEDRFDRIVRLAATAIGTPVSYISLVAAERQWFKSRKGLETESSPRETSFCGHAIAQNDLFVVEDLSKDPRFAGNPMVIGPPHARFYAGMPLALKPGLNVGTLCVLDHQPRKLDERERSIMKELASLVIREMELTDIIRSQENLLTIREELIAEKSRAEELLLNILPRGIAAELQKHGKVEAKRFCQARIMFTDFSNFTQVSSGLTPEELLRELNVCFIAFDQITDELGIEKLKTIGDAYLCANGLDDDEKDSSMRLLEGARRIRDFIRSRQGAKFGSGMNYWGVRIGLHKGPIVGGVVGKRKFAFDIWGDTVNTASRLESAGEPGRINVSATFAADLPDFVALEPRGKIQIKGKEAMEMFFVTG